MHPDISGRLLALNHQFYQTFAVAFSQTRQRIQPGVRRYFAGLDRGSVLRLLDLGCGNGDLAVELAQQGWQGTYLGVDFSAGLLEEASAWQANLAENSDLQIKFRSANLANLDWEKDLPEDNYSLITAFAVFHHLPGMELRRQIAAQVRSRLVPGGHFVLSNWQFLNSPRLAARCLEWGQIGIDEGELDPGDYLLDWRSGGSGLRYVHHFTIQELTDLAVETGFRVVETYLSDGKEGNLGLYQVWEA